MSKKKASRRGARASAVHDGEGAERASDSSAKQKDSDSAHEPYESGDVREQQTAKSVVTDTDTVAYRWGGLIVWMILVGLIAIGMLVQVLTD